MTLIYVQAAATTAAQTDLLLNSIHRLSHNARVISGVRMVGSAAIGDAQVALYVGDTLVARFPNMAAGATAGLAGDEMFPVDAYVPPGTEIRAIVTDAPATNALQLIMQLDDVAGGASNTVMA